LRLAAVCAEVSPKLNLTGAPLDFPLQKTNTQMMRGTSE
jgi:hypothetical protein